MTLRVVTYNIQHGRNLAGSLNLDRCGRELSLLDADIIALQEVDHCRWGTHLKDQARMLARMLGMHYVYGAVRNYTIGSYGNALLSRYPIRAYRNHVMTPDEDLRCCLEAEIAAEGVELTVLVLHLGLKSADRLVQVQDTVIPLVQHCETPCIAAGDFNCGPEYREIRMMTEHMSDAFTQNTGSEQNTFPADHPHIRIDYIFTSHCQARSCRIITEAASSDHLPVMAEIDPAGLPAQAQPVIKFQYLNQ